MKYRYDDKIYIESSILDFRLSRWWDVMILVSREQFLKLFRFRLEEADCNVYKTLARIASTTETRLLPGNQYREFSVAKKAC